MILENNQKDRGISLTARYISTKKFPPSLGRGEITVKEVHYDNEIATAFHEESLHLWV